MSTDPKNDRRDLQADAERPGFQLDKLESRILLSATWADVDAEEANIDAEVDAGGDGDFPELSSDGSGDDLFDAIDSVPLPAPEAGDYDLTVDEDGSAVTEDVLGDDGQVVTTVMYETSFEETGPAEGKWGVFDEIDGWQVGDGSGIEVQNAIAGDASDGTSHLELDSHDNSSMYRDLPTDGGQSYTLSFDYSPRPGVAAESNGIEVWWGGEKVGEITEDGRGLSGTDWQRVSFELPGDANAEDARLEIRAVGTEDSLGGYLDALRIEAHTPQQLDVDGYTQPEHGTVTYNGDGTFSYTPDPDYHGQDSFEYRVVDQFGQTSTGTIDVTVEDVPDLVTENATGLEDSAIPLSISLADMDDAIVQSIEVSNVPDGAMLSAGQDLGDGVWRLEPDDLDGLSVTPAGDFSGTFDLSIDVEVAEGQSVGFDADTLLSHGGSGQDRSGPAEVMDNGETLYMAENSWKAVPGDYTVTEDTILEFQFRSTQEPELSMIGFDNDARWNNGAERNHHFILHGTQSHGDAATNAFNNYEGDGEWQTYRIPVGEFFTGDFDRMFFLNDDDDNLRTEADDYQGNSSFSNVRLYEASETTTLNSTLTVDVEAVADGVDLTTEDASGVEDTEIPLNIEIAEVDVDGSEAVVEVRIAGVPDGATLSAGNDLGDGVWSLTAEGVDGLTITPAANSDADFDLTVETMTAEPVLSLSTVGDGLESVTGEWSATDGVLSADSTDGARHHAVATFEAGDLPDSFVIDATFEADRVPGQWQNGFVIFDYQGPDDFKFVGARVGADYWAIGEVSDGNWRHTDRLPERIDTGRDYDMRVSVDGDTVTLSVDGVEKLSKSYDERPDFSTLGLSNDNAATSFKSFDVMDLGNAVTQSDTIHVEVEAQADAIAVSVSDASGQEDTAIPLSIEASLTDTDGSERFAVVVSNVPTGANLSAGEPLGNGEWMLRDGEWEGLSLTPAEDFSGTIELAINTVSIDADGVPSGEMIIEGEQVTLDIEFAVDGDDAVDEIAGDWTTDANGLTVESDDATGLGLALIDRPVNSDVFTVETTFVSERVPGQWQNSFVVFDADGEGNFKFVGARVGADYWTIGEYTDGAWRNLVTLPERIDTGEPYGMSVAFDGGAVSLSVDGEAKLSYDFGDGLDTSTLGLANHKATTATQDFTVTDASSRVEGTTLTVDVQGAADAAELSTPDAITATQGLNFPLDLSAALTDTDGSESLVVRLDGFPDGTTFNVGQPSGDGGWLVSGNAIDALTAQTPDSFTGEFTLSVTAITTEADGDAIETNATIDVRVLGLEEELGSDNEPSVTPGAIGAGAGSDAEAAFERVQRVVGEAEDALDAISADPVALAAGVQYEPFALPATPDAASPTYELEAASFEIEQTVEEAAGTEREPSSDGSGVENADDPADEPVESSAGDGFAAKFWALMRGVSVTRNDRDD